MSCSDDWYETKFYGNDTFSVLQPKQAIKCYDTLVNDVSKSGKETGLIVAITMIAGLLFLLYIMCKSCTTVGIDWYRLLAVYILGTIGVPLSLALGPSQPGFNKIAGFGILVHNLGEWFIIDRVWFGAKFCTALAPICYVWIIMALIVFIPHTPLFLILMLQGTAVYIYINLVFVTKIIIILIFRCIL